MADEIVRDLPSASASAAHSGHGSDQRRGDGPMAVDGSGSQATGPPRRPVVPGLRRRRYDLSIPPSLSRRLAASGRNPADLVFQAQATHGDAIISGTQGSRPAERGRVRLRLQLADDEHQRLLTLGRQRHWNLSQTVTVLLDLFLPPG